MYKPQSGGPTREAIMTLDIGSRRELFVDHHLIERLDGAGLKLHEPRREGVAVRFDYPWEGPLSGYFTPDFPGDL